MDITLIKVWSDTSTMLTTATGAYAGHPITVTLQGITNGTPEYQAWLDKLTILERFNGRTYRVVPAGSEARILNFSGYPTRRNLRIVWRREIGKKD